MKPIRPLMAFALIASCQPRTFNNFGETAAILTRNGERIRRVTSPDMLPPPLASRMGGIGRGQPACTYTYLGRFNGRALALTAGHCYVNNDQHSPDQICSRTEIVWGYWGNTPEPPPQLLRTRCKGVVAWEKVDNVFDAFTDWRTDYALIEIDLPLNVNLPSFEVDFSKPDHRKPIVILSHPKGMPLHYSEPCKMFYMDYNAFKGIYRMGDFDYDGRIFRFLHTCDTDHGSSGAAILDAATFKIIGIHTGSPQNRGAQILDAILPTNDPDRSLPPHPDRPWASGGSISAINQGTFIYKTPIGQFLR